MYRREVGRIEEKVGGGRGVGCMERDKQVRLKKRLVEEDVWCTERGKYVCSEVGPTHSVTSHPRIG